MNSKKNRFSAVRRALRPACVLLAGGVALAAWAQVPSQAPLLSRVSDPPPPNVMITIDDSGSMQAHLHLRVDDLDAAERAALDLGAGRPAHQPDPSRHRVLNDPAGHPFCICPRPAR